MTVEPLRAGNECELILKFVNPTQHQTVIQFLPFFLEEEETTDAETEEAVTTIVDDVTDVTGVSFSQPL